MASPDATRRRFLAGASALLSAGLAGCGTGGDGTVRRTDSPTAPDTETAAGTASTRATPPPADAPRDTTTPTPSSPFSLDGSGDDLDIVGSSGPVARYVYGYDPARRQETYKTYLHVVDPETGEPITSGPTGLYDHHRGIFLGWDELTVGGESHDFWHFDGDERMVHGSFEGRDSFSRTGVLTAVNRWITGDDRTVLEESREMRFREHPSGDGIVTIDLATTLTATDESVHLRGDPEHAGVQYRPHNDVAGNESAEYVFPEGVFSDPDPGPGRVTDETGLPWVGQTHTIGGRRYFVQHANHPDNPADTVYSAYRPYGRFGAFFEAEIPAGESLTVRYRFGIERGGAPPRDELESRYEDFAGSDGS